MDQYLPRFYQQGAGEAAISIGEALPETSVVNRLAVEALAMRAAHDVDEALNSIVPTLGRMFIDTQQRLVREEEIAAQIAEGIVRGVGARELGRRISQTLRDGATQRLRGLLSPELAQQLKDTAEGRFITITCRDGKDRRYNLKWYGETVAHTHAAQAATEGGLRTAATFAADLVRITFHEGACPMCIPIQGKIYSLSGRNTHFPLYTEDVRTPIHPRCRHYTIPVSELALRMTGEYEEMMAYSRGDQPAVTTWEEYQRAAPLTTGAKVPERLAA
jgi:hypothetical protein